MEQETKICQNCKASFTIDAQDFSFYEKIKVPAPTWCPECRMIRRMLWRNERSLYKRKCDLCKKDIISTYPEKVIFPVYCSECWWSDNWQATNYAREYDFDKSFFSQYKDLFFSVPRMALSIRKSINADFANFLGESKNVYLSYSVIKGSEEVYYSKNVDKSLFVFDCFGAMECQKCFENVSSGRNYNCFYNDYTHECLDCFFLYNCVNCKNCFMCTNLRNKEYYFRNKPYSREDYINRLKEINFGDYKIENELKKEFFLMKEKSLHRYANIIKSINISGDDVFNSKNAKKAFWAYNLENVNYVFRSNNMKDSMDIAHAVDSELFYEYISGGAESGFMVKLSISGFPDLQNISYSDFCGSSSNLFGCSSLRNKEYCILNKQYTKQEYEDMIPRIIEQMNSMPYISKRKDPSTGSGQVYKYGEFFPPELSPFCYNETVAQEYFPLTKEQALAQGYSWKDQEERNISIDIRTEDLPDHIKDVKDDIIGKVIQCANAKFSESGTQKINQFSQCTSAFKIIPQELEFYRKMNLPLPRLCPNCRHYQRLKQRNPLKLWHRQCMCGHPTSSYANTIEHFHKDKPCPNEFETSYASDRPEIVYCEECYKREVE